MGPRPALDIALAYHRAWTSGDMDAALTYVAAEIVFDAPPGRLHGAEALRGFMEPFATSLIASTVLAAHGSQEQAMIMYDTTNPAVPSAPAAELYEVRDGRITAGRIIFDRLPFALARGQVMPRQD
jgi:ketosteroid isomerase-like protein